MRAPLPLPLDVRLMAVATRALLVVAALGVLGWVGVWLMRHPVWTVQRIVVVGDVARQNAATLRAHLAAPPHGDLQGSFLSLDLQRWRAVFESAPWVRQAVVRREFPNRLRVILTEHQAVAWWGEAGSGRLVNAQGEVFEAGFDAPDELPELEGPAGRSKEVLGLWQRLREETMRLGLGLDRLELDERGTWRATLDNGAHLELGRGEPDALVARLQRFTTTLSQVTPRPAQRLQSADLRYPSGYALRLRGVSTREGESATSFASTP